MATTTIRESTISKTVEYLNMIKGMVEKNPTMPLSGMKKEATKMHVGTTYIDQAIALGYFSRNQSGKWKPGIAPGNNFTSTNARAVIEKSNEYNRALVKARKRKAAAPKIARKPAQPVRPVIAKRSRIAESSDRAIQKYLTDRIVIDQFMKKHLISDLDICVLTAELHRRGLQGTLSGSIKV
jgi:hypothetical protein